MKRVSSLGETLKTAKARKLQRLQEEENRKHEALGQSPYLVVSAMNQALDYMDDVLEKAAEEGHCGVNLIDLPLWPPTWITSEGSSFLDKKKMETGEALIAAFIGRHPEFTRVQAEQSLDAFPFAVHYNGKVFHRIAFQWK